MGYRGSYPGGTADEELSYSPPSSSVVKKEWRHIFAPPICLYGVGIPITPHYSFPYHVTSPLSEVHRKITQ